MLGKIVEPCGEVAEAFGVGIDRPVEAADRHFIGVAGIDHDRVRVGDQSVPFGRIDIGALLGGGVNTLDAHRDDLLLQPNLHPQKGHGAGLGIFDLEIGKTGQQSQAVDHRIDSSGRTGNGAVDAFVGQQDRALEAMLLAQGEHLQTQRGGVVNHGEMIERGDFYGRYRFGHGSAYREVTREIPIEQLASPE